MIAIFVSGFLVGFTGFGFNLLAVPALALLTPAKDAVIVTLFLGTVVNVVMTVAYRRHVEVRVAAVLIAASVPGLLFGTVLFSLMTPGVLRVVIGALTVVFAVVLLLRKAPVAVTPRKLVTAGTGLLSGALTSTTGMGGPPVAAYLVSGVAEVDRVRATLMFYTAMASVAALALLGVSGDVSSGQMIQAAQLAPFGLAGVVAGALVFRKFPHLYVRAVALTLVLVGAGGFLVAVI
ncbi:sulfite exporter TauE/SafE family protein [Jiangella asiatica]|uniref:Probable membrane transporter protein n=1 Tax=Jiangella asiatica TaxID=2530372 RepID=A0A4R5DL86_9ACTN|nr:sulfite exporter TauE/SafE family protein [Jiangella asiatica]TDE14986.1 sulfite exporter TauE/SafE family protein [Jiangella asiatica]